MAFLVCTSITGELDAFTDSGVERERRGLRLPSALWGLGQLVLALSLPH